MGKNLLKKALEEKKNETLEMFEILEQNIDKTYSLPDLYMQFVEIFGNTLVQAEYNIQFIKLVFNDEFYKNAETKIHPNSIEFFNENYSIQFPTSKKREITIKFTPSMEKPKMDLLEINLRKNHLKDYVETNDKESLRKYFVLKLYDNGKILDFLYQDLSFSEKFMVEVEMKKFSMDKAKEKLSELEELISFAMSKHNEKLEQYNKEIEDAAEFIGNMHSLKLFNQNGFAFRFIDMTPPSWVKQIIEKKY